MSEELCTERTNSENGEKICGTLSFRHENGFKVKVLGETTVRSVPARRLFQFYFDDLSRIGDFNPLAVGFPAFGNDLNKNFSERRIRNMSDAFTVGLYVELDFLVFAQFAFFHVLQVDASVFHGCVGVTADDLDTEAIGLRGPRRSGRITGGIALGSSSSRNTTGHEERKGEHDKAFGIHELMRNIVHVSTQVGQATILENRMHFYS